MTMALQPRSYLFTRSSPNLTDPKNPGPKNGRSTRPPLRDEKREMSSAPETPSRPTSSPVIDIPVRGKNDHHSLDSRRPSQAKKHSKEKNNASAKRTRPMHHDSLPPSVAALLALTTIPRPKAGNSIQYRSGAGQRLTVDAILQHGTEEKEISMSYEKSPLDFLLSPPEDLDDDINESENGHESVMSTRTMSSESMPSLDGDSLSDASPSYSSVMTPSPRNRRPLFRRLHSVSTPAEDPLSSPEIDFEELDFRVFQRPQDKKEEIAIPCIVELESPRRKSAFKSNLTASLKALRSAAKSLSSLTAPMILPDDFLTRSIVSIDPRVPFTDERMPPRLEDTPTPALRRYLNPTTNAPIEAHVPSSLAQTMGSMQCTASIQMQTYKVSRSKKSTSPSVISRRTQPTSEEAFAEVAAGPVARQRDMRENSDFIRIAVMEMAMRKKGKLDDQKPGRARWALPPRKSPTRPYQISADGVPVRWIAITN